MIGPTNGKQDVGHLAKWNQILLIEDNVNQVDGPTTKPHSKAARPMAPFDRMHSQVQKSRPPSLASSKGAYGGFHCHMVWKQCKDPGKTCQFHTPLKELLHCSPKRIIALGFVGKPGHG